MSTLSPPIVQVPSTLWVPERNGTYGDEINGFAESIGIPRDLEQQRDIDCLASFGPKGRWLTLETAVIEGRQNGKTKSCLLSIALADLFLGFGGTDRIMWTAHLMKTTLDTFDRVQELIEANQSLARRVREVITRKSEEAVILKNGARLDFVARSDGSGRGLSGKRVILDEALFLMVTMMGALLPTLSAHDNPQVNYASSAGKQESDHLRSLQKRGRRGNDPSLILIEYRAPGGWDDPGCGLDTKCDHIYGNMANDVVNLRTGQFGCAMDREENWKKANHAITAGRMRVEFIRAERRALCQTPEGVLEFGRERMGWEELGTGVLDPDRIPENAWRNQTDPKSTPIGEVVFGVDMNPAGTHISISVAGLRTDKSVHFGTVEYRRGTAGIGKRMAELIAKHPTMCGVMWQPTAPIGSCRQQFQEAGVFMVDVSGPEYYEACGSFKSHIMNGTAWHRGTDVLNLAFQSAERRIHPEGGWGFGRRKSMGDISPLVSSVVAVKGVDDNGTRAPSVYTL